MTTSLKRWVRGIGAVMILVTLLVGVPIVLSRFVGWPLPVGDVSWNKISTALSSSAVPDAFVVKTLAIVVWVSWLQVTISFLVEAGAIVRGSVSRQLRGFGPMQALTGSLIAAVVMLSIPTRAAQHAPRFELAVTLSQPSPVAAGVSGNDVGQSKIAEVSAPTRVQYTVVRRDNLWKIASDHLGDPKRWTEIFEINKGRAQPDGDKLTEPDLIRPGWVLELPIEVPTTPAAEPDVANTDVLSSVGSTDVTAQPSEPSALVGVSTTTTTKVTTVDDSVTPVSGEEDADSRASYAVLASGSIVSLSLAASVTSALALLRLRRRRSYQPSMPEADIAFTDPTINEDLRQLQRMAIDNDASEGNDDIGVVAVGSTADEDVLIDLRQTGLLTLSGADASDRARSILVSHVTKTQPLDAEVRIAGTHLASELFGDIDVFDGFWIASDNDALFQKLESEIVGRRRKLLECDVEAVGQLREIAPTEVGPVLLAVFRDIASEEWARLEAVVSAGRELEVFAVLLSSDADDSTMMADIAYGMTATEAHDVLSVVHSNRRWDQPVLPMTELPTESVELDEQPDVGSVHDVSDEVTSPVRVRVFGTPCIEVDGIEVKATMRAKSLELAVFLALRPAGATIDVIGAALWPQANRKQAGERFATVASDLRRVLRAESGLTDEAFLDHSNVYRLDTSLVTSDFANFESAIATSRQATTNAVQASALQTAIAQYVDHLGGESSYEWMDDAREHLRRRALDAMMQLARIAQESGDAEGALVVLNRAIECDPYAEYVYQRVMELQTKLGRADAAQRTGRLIVERLAELDLEPSPETEDLMSQTMRVLEAERRKAG